MTGTPGGFPAFAPGAPRPYRELLADGVATIPFCADCGRWFYYPRPRCPRCLGDRIRHDPVPGPLTVTAAARVWRPQADVFLDRVPVLMVAARLAADATVIAEGWGWPDGDLPVVGSTVHYEIRTREPGLPLPVFVPTSAGGSPADLAVKGHKS